jgi:phage-related protein
VSISVSYFETTRGDRPVQKYLESLPPKERIMVKALIDHLSEKVVLNEPHSKKLSGYSGLYELRPGSHRIFYCYYEGKVVLLHAFRKSSNKTPKREIETAYKRMIS